MSGRRRALIAMGLADEVTARLAARGVAPERAEVLAVVWPLAKRLARSEKAARRANLAQRVAYRAYAQVAGAAEQALDAAVAAWSGQSGGSGRPQFAEFDPQAWRLALQPADVPDPVRARREAA